MDGVTSAQALAPGSTVINPHILAGCTALVVAVMLLLVYVYRRRLFILWGMGAWFLIAASMAPVSRSYGNPEIGGVGERLWPCPGRVRPRPLVVAAGRVRGKRRAPAR